MDRAWIGSPSATGSACRGSAGPAASARSAAPGGENLCAEARFTGYQIDGGYAEHTVADARFCFAIPAGYSDVEAAPLLCAGLIGYRALVMAGEARRLGLYGFGAAAHIIAQVARWQGRTIFAFTSPGDAAAQAFARGLGATWAGRLRQPRRPSRSTRRSSSPRSARWCPSRCAPSNAAAPWSAPAST